MENKQSVLVIDDSPPFRRIAESALSQEGFDIITANNEQSGLETAQRELPSLILVDLVPTMDSYQFCKNIRRDSTLNDIPIVFLSSGNETDGQDYNEKFDNVQYVQKTSGIEALTKTLRETLAGSERTAVSPSIDSFSEDNRANDSGEEAVSHMPDGITSLPIEVSMPEVTLSEPLNVGNEPEGDPHVASTNKDARSHDPVELDSMFSNMAFVDITTSENSLLHNPDENTPDKTVPEAAASDIEIDLPDPLQIDTLPEAVPSLDSSEDDTFSADTPTMETPASEPVVVNSEESEVTAVKESVLVVDDSPTVRRLAELVLSQEGYTVFTAEDGDVGLEIARSEMPSIILVDFIMPKMNGFQFCKSIKADTALSSIPLILITSKGEEVGQGFDEQFSIARYLKKPFETETLTKTVKEVLAEREEVPDALSEVAPVEDTPVVVAPVETVPEAAAPDREIDLPAPLQIDTLPEAVPSLDSSEDDTFSADTPTMETPASEPVVVNSEESEVTAVKESVLVVDDSPTVRRLAELVLSQEGYTVFTAEDGDVGLEIARSEMPSIILVDFIMPKMNGFQFCKSIKADTALSSIPLILITSKGEEVGQGFDEQFSIARYLKKPFETETLTKTVKEVLAEREEVPDALSEVAPVEDTPVVVAPVETAPEAAAPHTERDSEIPVRTDYPPADIPVADTVTADTQETGSPSPADKPAEPVYTELMENIEKEFRHYFGQELTVLLKSTMFQVLKETNLLRSSGHILSGEIKYISVASTLQFVKTAGLSGKLSVSTDSFNVEIYLDSGQIACASINKPGCRTCLEELILKDGKSGQEVLSVLSEAGGNSLTAGRILLERGLISENELSEYFRHLSEDAVKQTLSASTGHFYIEDVPLPGIVQHFKLRIPVNGSGDNGICVQDEHIT